MPFSVVTAASALWAPLRPQARVNIGRVTGMKIRQAFLSAARLIAKKVCTLLQCS